MWLRYRHFMAPRWGGGLPLFGITSLTQFSRKTSTWSALNLWMPPTVIPFRGDDGEGALIHNACSKNSSAGDTAAPFTKVLRPLKGSVLGVSDSGGIARMLSHAASTPGYQLSSLWDEFDL